jgi:hypothetical protein
VGHENQLAALSDDFANRRQRGPDAGIVRDLAPLERHVEVHPHQHPLFPDIDSVDRELFH